MAKDDYERDQIFLFVLFSFSQWFHDRERCINCFFFRNHSFVFITFYCLYSPSALPKPAQEHLCTSVHWSYLQAQKNCNPSVSYPILQLWLHWLWQHIVSLSYLGPGLTHMELHGTSPHCQGLYLVTKSDQGAVPKEETAPPCSMCLHTWSSRMHRSLKTQWEKSIKIDWIVLRASQHLCTQNPKCLITILLKQNILGQRYLLLQCENTMKLKHSAFFPLFLSSFFVNL